MSLFSTLKTNSKKALSNNWAPAIAVSFIPVLLTVIIHALALFLSRIIMPEGVLVAFGEMAGTANIFQHLLSVTVNVPMLIVWASICLIFALITFFVVTPLFLGLSYWNLELVKGNTQGISSLFHYFETGRNYRRALGLDISLTIRRVLWGILIFTIPCGLNHILAIAGSYYANVIVEPSYRILYWVARLLILLIIVSLWIVYGVITNKYFLAEYFLAEDDTIKSGEAIKKSVIYTKGYRANILKYKLSFIGWALLSVLIVPAFYAVPYYNSAAAIYALYLQETVKREKPVLEDKPPTAKEEIKPEIISGLSEKTDERANYNLNNQVANFSPLATGKELAENSSQPDE